MATPVIVLLLTVANASWAGDTRYTNTDNENNAGTGVADNDMDQRAPHRIQHSGPGGANHQRSADGAGL
jgi:hypothetical protein